MPEHADSTAYTSDSAAVFASALSLWEASRKREAADGRLSLSERFNGLDEFMRKVMRIATQFEAWACLHLDFDLLDGVWPYLLKDEFGKACLAAVPTDAMIEFDDNDCLRIALRLRLPFKLDDMLPIPVDVRSPNPISGSSFKEFRIQTVRDSIETELIAPFTEDSDPFDAEYAAPYFGLYGVSDDELLEHIADRATYAEAVRLALKLAPGIEFPVTPTFTYTMSRK
jgi:hypothetical protein